MELNQVYELWNRFDASSTVELELELQGAKLHLRKDTSAWAAGGNTAGQLAGWTTGVPANVTGPQTACPQIAAAPVNPADASVNPADQQDTMSVSDAKPMYKEVKAPLVGTFYRGSSPEAEPFVKVGQQVRKGEVVGIIEAMKLMNEVTADCDGEVVEITVPDATFVEYDQVLIRLQ